ncbi:exonuclease SbcCD subunit D [Pseudanabaena sp. FACHB-2040]|uniref:metallophosphoesterase family protein n=1 Tax=Pseudanabaena sp. FACHB-2040 TaxID=2692859 RepID=UPI00168286D7|nr:exonuclease SbcCD subunit D [Pseudanabaena sp. FACHB-2040]MBD2258085.1 exonuclease SbcCD subunit D [Pseudanabaena sp. FACHB-2040]
MAKFLHIADIHLGFDRYDSRERTRDFFLALQDVLQRYAVEERVDFVLIAGDLFEHRNIQPATLNQAQLCLQDLQKAGIPVLAIEGNHDNRPYGTRTSWLKYLSEWGLLKLLEPGDVAAGEPFYFPWDDNTRRGGYVDLACGVRVVGANWYGAAAPKAIEQIATAIEALPPGPEHTVLMFHHGLEGQIARYSGALRYSDLLPLKMVGVDYLALGHIHKQYSVENWVFNPGSLAANNIEEASFQRGAYCVEIDDQGVQADLKTDYYQRPVVRLSLTLRGQESQEDLIEAAEKTVQAAIATGDLDPTAGPIVELRIEGQVGFDRLDLDIRQLQATLQQQSGALIFLLKYNVEAVAYSTPVSELSNRMQIEETIFTDLLAAHRDYKGRCTTLAKGLMDLKDRQLTGAVEPDLYQFIQAMLEDSPGKA